MRAAVVSEPAGKFEIVNLPIPTPANNEVLIKVEACGICHGDSVTVEGGFDGKCKLPRIPGHEIIGIIKEIGKNAKGSWKVGQRVGVGWHADHCGSCNECIHGEFGACKFAKVTGLDVDGGYAEYMISKTEALSEIPENLDPIISAPIMCAGRTTFGALIEGNAKPGDLVAISGFGGLGHLALKYAKEMGFVVAVISRGQAKKELAVKMGARYYIDSQTGDVSKELMKLGGAKLILATAPNAKILEKLTDGICRNGTIMIITYVGQPMNFVAGKLLHSNGIIRGWTGGVASDALKFSSSNLILPTVETFKLDEVQKAYDKMMSGEVKFRAVITF